MLEIPVAADSNKQFTCCQEPYQIFVGSWNVGGISPSEDFDMSDWLNSRKSLSDIHVLGFQEIVPLNAGNVLLMNDNKKVSEKWNSLIRATLNKRLPSFVKANKDSSKRTSRSIPVHHKQANGGDFHNYLGQK